MTTAKKAAPKKRTPAKKSPTKTKLVPVDDPLHVPPVIDVKGLNNSVQEILTNGDARTREFRAITAAELIKTKVVEAYQL